MLVAWASAEGAQRKGLPGNLIALLLFPLSVGPLVLQPDFGQTMLISLSGRSCSSWPDCIGSGSPALAGWALPRRCSPPFVPHVHARIQTFLEPPPPVTAGVPTNFQGETALESFISGSWFGKGPGEGTIKRMVPDSHTDYLFAVVGEEFGVLTCMALAALFAFIVVRSLLLASRNEDPFCRFATAGLAMLFGLQGAINMMVNLQLMPAKGMTFPFVSYGGSSLLSLALSWAFFSRHRQAATQRRSTGDHPSEAAALPAPAPSPAR